MKCSIGCFKKDFTALEIHINLLSKGTELFTGTGPGVFLKENTKFSYLKLKISM